MEVLFVPKYLMQFCVELFTQNVMFFIVASSKEVLLLPQNTVP